MCSSGGDRNEDYPFPAWCVNCSKGQILSIKPQALYEETWKFPKICPVCKQPKCYPLFYCKKDGSAFPDQTTEIWNWGNPVACPDCKQRSMSVDSLRQIGALKLQEYFNLTEDQKKEINKINSEAPSDGMESAPQ